MSAEPQANPYSAEDFAAPVLAEVAAMDTEDIGKELVRFGGGDFWNLHYYQDAFERMTPERALGLYVLAQALNDIEPLDREPDPRWNPQRQTEHFQHEHVLRLQRVAHHQSVEESLRREWLQFKSEYRAAWRTLRREKKVRLSMKGRTPVKAKTARRRDSLRTFYDSKARYFQTRRESLDPTNTTLEWCLNDKADVRMWCDIADVNLERFYAAVERRLLLKGRCSVELHRLLVDMRAVKATGPTAHYLLARFEDKAFAA